MQTCHPITVNFRHITDTTSADYRFAEETLTELFPREEYRDLEVWRDYVAHKPAFRLLVAHDGEQPVGLLSYWHFRWFCYVEHLGVTPARQGQGYGAMMLRVFQQATRLPIVLEVELPAAPAARRRIAFYERQGFRLSSLSYAQPPYRPGDAPVPMRLMGYGWSDETQGEAMKEVIYREVYCWKKQSSE
jgi:GNAT superfamily N-acetyltransferase